MSENRPWWVEEVNRFIKRVVVNNKACACDDDYQCVHCHSRIVLETFNEQIFKAVNERGKMVDFLHLILDRQSDRKAGVLIDTTFANEAEWARALLEEMGE